MKKIKSLVTVFMCYFSSFYVCADNGYILEGEISGYLVTIDKCYASIHDDDHKFYSDQWHVGENKGICDFIKMAYLVNIPVVAKVVVDSNVNNTNNIQSIHSTRCGITWPPYHIKNNKDCKKNNQTSIL